MGGRGWGSAKPGRNECKRPLLHIPQAFSAGGHGGQEVSSCRTYTRCFGFGTTDIVPRGRGEVKTYLSWAKYWGGGGGGQSSTGSNSCSSPSSAFDVMTVLNPQAGGC